MCILFLMEANQLAYDDALALEAYDGEVVARAAAGTRATLCRRRPPAISSCRARASADTCMN